MFIVACCQHHLRLVFSSKTDRVFEKGHFQSFFENTIVWYEALKHLWQILQLLQFTPIWGNIIFTPGTHWCWF